jgi:hypothetical protein
MNFSFFKQNINVIYKEIQLPMNKHTTQGIDDIQEDPLKDGDQ